MSKGNARADTIDLDFMEIGRVLLKKKIWIILTGVLFAASAAVGTKFLMTPQYLSTTKMVILTKESEKTVTNADLQASSLLTKDYAELIRSRSVLENAAIKLGLDESYEQMLKKVSVETKEDTRIVSISVSDEDPQRAAEIADTIRETAAVHIQEVMDTGAINVVDLANVPANPYKPSARRNGMVGGVIGILLGSIVITLMYLLNDSLKATQDVEKYLELSVLGNIPEPAKEKHGRRGRK